MIRTTVDFSKLSILIVENNALMRRLLVEMLRGFGANEIYQASSVPEGLDVAYGERLDAIILDFFLDEMDGADFAKRVRHDETCQNRQVPILLITGAPDHYKVLRVLDAGINGMLAKPIAPKDLYQRLNTILTDRKPFVITNEYVGPMRKRKLPPARTRPLIEPRTYDRRNMSAPVRRSKASDHVFEDGILI